MEIFSQKDPRWGEKELGSSGLKMKNFGCLVTAIAQSLYNAGWDVNPGSLVDGLNSVGGFDSEGLLNWYKVQEVYSAFHFNGEGTVPVPTVKATFVKGSWGVYKHWVLDMNGLFEPYYGKNTLPTTYTELSRSRFAFIDIKEVIETPVEVVPAPQPEAVIPQPEILTQPQIFVYTVKSGDNLTNICRDHYGLDKASGEAYRKALEIARYNNISDPNLIHPLQEILLP
jgi:hypothetical protein